MNSNFSYDRYAAARSESRLGSRGAVWAMVAACVLAPVCAGCQSGGQEIPHCPPFEYLEQGCFGYEPTIWRTMPGDCPQAIRLIPDPQVDVPQQTDAGTSQGTAPPARKEKPEGSGRPMLDEVPGSAPLDLPDMLEPPVDEPSETPDKPAETTPPSVSPSAVPDVPPATEPPTTESDAKPPATKIPPEKTRPETEDQTEAKKPTSDQPRENSPDDPTADDPTADDAGTAEPAEPEFAPENPKTSAKAQPPVSASPTQLTPTLNGPVAQASTSKRAAGALFRTVSRALEQPSRSMDADGRSRDDKPAAGLSRFISY
ncbi:MAG: hypothetical protein ACODAD_15130 [Planctomycetota bacterium]